MRRSATRHGPSSTLTSQILALVSAPAVATVESVERFIALPQFIRIHVNEFTICA